jgi:transcriptional regulator with XRE-family HTH domain
MTPGARISILRKTKGLSQESLAEATKISLRTIQRIESDNTMPRPYTLKAIATALDVSMDEFTGETTGSPNDLLRAMNFSALSVIVLPVAHIFIVLFASRLQAHQMPTAGKRILGFQILWTIITALLLVIIHGLQFTLTNSKMIGHFPPTIIIVYVMLLIVNVIFTIRASYRIDRGERDIFSFIPALF